MGSRRHEGKLGDGSCWSDAPNLVAARFREPQVAIRPASDPFRDTVGCWDGELGNNPLEGDTPDFASIPFGKPEGAVGSGGNPRWTAVGCWQKGEFGNNPLGGDMSI